MHSTIYMQLNGLLFPFAEMLHLKESPYSSESKARCSLKMPLYAMIVYAALMKLMTERDVIFFGDESNHLLE